MSQDCNNRNLLIVLFVNDFSMTSTLWRCMVTSERARLSQVYLIEIRDNIHSHFAL